MKDIYVIAAFLALIVSYRVVSDKTSSDTYYRPTVFRNPEYRTVSLRFQTEKSDFQLNNLGKERPFKDGYENDLLKKPGK